MIEKPLEARISELISDSLESTAKLREARQLLLEQNGVHRRLKEENERLSLEVDKFCYELFQLLYPKLVAPLIWDRAQFDLIVDAVKTLKEQLDD